VCAPLPFPSELDLIRPKEAAGVGRGVLPVFDAHVPLFTCLAPVLSSPAPLFIVGASRLAQHVHVKHFSTGSPIRCPDCGGVFVAAVSGYLPLVWALDRYGRPAAATGRHLGLPTTDGEDQAELSRGTGRLRTDPPLDEHSTAPPGRTFPSAP
jgi:hypothetical protein